MAGGFCTSELKLLGPVQLKLAPARELEANRFNVPPTHNGPELLATVAGIGFTVTVNVIVGPVQLFALGVTVTVATIGALVKLVAV